MGAPLIRYVTTADGVNIAYWTVGRGPRFVSLPGLPHSHILMEWEMPELRRSYELGAAALTMVRYDGRGTGLSQRDVSDFPMEAHLADLDAVVGAIGGGPVILNANSNTCPIAIAYAVQHPERVSHLVLWAPVVNGTVQRDNLMLRAARQLAHTNWDMFCQTVAHSLLGWEESEASLRFAALIKAGIEQETIFPLIEGLHEMDVTGQLAHVRCPTLVMHRPAMPLLDSGAAERVAAAIPGARLALFEGAASAQFIGDWRAVDRAIGTFLGLAPQHRRREGVRALRLLTMKDEALTPREREVVELVARGLTNREIAQELVLAHKTVENHIGRILVKLDLRKRTQLAAYAVEHGLAGKTAG